MRYIDKNTKKGVILTPIEGKYMIKFREGFDGESIAYRVNEFEHFQHIKMIPEDSLALITFDSEAERTQSMKQLLSDIKKDDAVESIITAFQDHENFERYLLPEKILVCHQPEHQEEFIALLDDELTVFKRSKFGNWTIVNIPIGSDLAEHINYFDKFNIVKFSEPVYYGVNDIEGWSAGETLWNISSINLESAWEATRGISEIVIAVIDGKPDLNHDVFLKSGITDIPLEQIFTLSNELSSHSTQILGLLAGKNSVYSGISPDVSLLPLVVRLSAQNYSERAEAIFFLEQAMNKKNIGKKSFSRIVANCSWKTAGDVGIIREAMQAASQAGVIFITSAGNENTDSPHYPSDYSKIYEGMISVAALAPDDTKAVYSNYSETVDIAAPGGDGLPLDSRDIYCPDVDNSFQYSAGTSIAAPHVAGVIALMLSVNTDLSIGEIKRILKSTASSVRGKNFDTWTLLGAGKINAGQAVKEALKLKVPKPSEPDTSHQHTSTPQGSGEINNTSTDDIDSVVSKVSEKIIQEIKLMIKKNTAQYRGKNLLVSIELSSQSVMITIAL